RILEAGAQTVLSNDDIAKALKQALNKGVKTGVQYLAKENGFLGTQYKIPLPDEAGQVIEKLKIIPAFAKIEQQVIEKINRSAEDAMKKATPIFVNAITSMTISDAMNILMGEKNSATNYLNKTTYNGLYGEFEPVIVTSLNKFGALDLWTDAVSKYNSLPFVKKLNPKLEDYIAKKALIALFDRIEKEEVNIRNNAAARTTDLMKQVFSKQDKA
ncbi:DUF4197 domain-containing protein, partial [Saprospiraceae bacterium]|nr:DUF4197 domain-containing protein [Saprospiraceae bacterium]